MDDEFPPYMFEILGNYVYRLVDPRNGRTFYVGRGVRNRVYDHAREALKGDVDDYDSVSLKVERIREITASDVKVEPIIHRFGLTQEQAIHVEAALIAAYLPEELTNIQGGEGNGMLGPIPANELIIQHSATEFGDHGDKLMLVCIGNTHDESERSTYDATRAAWRASTDRVNRADFVLGVSRGGLVRGVYKPREWLVATRKNFPFLERDFFDRRGFVGNEGCPDTKAKYLHKLVPEGLRFSPRGSLRYNYD